MQGEPGIYSARYAGDGATDLQNNLQLIQKIQDVPEEERHAYFECVMVFLRHAMDPSPLIASGRWHGVIVTDARGENGFGYDPLFYVPSFHCTGAELDLAVKNTLSHRGQALRQLLALITQEISLPDCDHHD